VVYQIIKRDPNIMGFSIVLALAQIANPIVAAKAPELLVVMNWMAPMGFLIAWACQRATRFEMALPIPGRQVFLARMAELLTTLWLGAITASGCALLLSGAKGPSLAWAMVEGASIMTLVGACLHALRAEQHRIPLWLGAVPVWLMIMGLAGEASKHADRIPPFGVAGAERLIAGCLILSAAVLAWVWSRVPKSYQLAPVGGPQPSRAPYAAAQRFRSLPSFTWAWMPLLRPMFSWQSVFLWPFLFFVGGMPAGASFVCYLLAMGWVGLRPRIVWLRPLPVRPSVALAGLVAPSFALIVLGNLLLGARWAHEPHARILSVTVTLGWALVTLLVLSLYDWRPLRRIPWKWRLWTVFALSIAAMIAPVASGVKPASLARWALHLPASLPLAVLVCCVPLLILALLLDRVAANPEYTSVPRMPQKELN
jgi:hypothetical protein